MGIAAPVTPTSAAAHAFVADLGAPRLAPDDAHHLTRVLRLAAGTDVTVGDGAGRWRPARLAGGEELAATGDVAADPRPEPPITIAFALVKGDRPELVVQKLTELGADRIVPFVAERSVVRWDAAKAGRQAERLAAIARAAAMQCRRTWLPEVAPLATFADVAALPGAAMADRGGGAPRLTLPVVLVGPEGGWSPAERSSTIPRVRLGPHVLRAETASITSCVILSALRDEVVAST
ncbi:MAG TPA: RsmE family RNA methyltransferase [Acidimicrobiales bacterium]|nr:RsmE family RNA methyltransferase [Acidimicrobiales bacterium]